MNKIRLMAPRGWWLRIGATVLALVLPPLLLSVAVVRAILVPGALPAPLQVGVFVWFSAVVGYFLLLGWKLGARLRSAAAFVEIQPDSMTVFAQRKAEPICRLISQTDANPAHVRIETATRSFFISDEWSNFADAVEFVTIRNAAFHEAGEASTNGTDSEIEFEFEDEARLPLAEWRAEKSRVDAKNDD